MDTPKITQLVIVPLASGPGVTITAHYEGTTQLTSLDLPVDAPADVDPFVAGLNKLSLLQYVNLGFDWAPVGTPTPEAPTPAQ